MQPQLRIFDPDIVTDKSIQLFPRSEAKGVPVIVFSSPLPPGDVAEVLKLGAREYVPKPVRWDEFQDAVVGIISRWTRRAM